ncbi:MAG: V-type ATP synthase subunit D [Deltaproteobacteria bacterium]|nr:V-type ATP synthase subunit D [Deltaproteobacteria bacterium]
MADIKLTKTELKKQKDSLKRFERYLPTLLLKKQQLQLELRKIEKAFREKQKEYEDFMQEIVVWIAVFNEEVTPALEKLVTVEKIEVINNNIAGIDIPVFEEVIFKDKDYNLFFTPLWVDRAIEALKKLIVLKTEYKIFQKQYDQIRKELTITTQRVNLFEKVKIPEACNNIRIIRIYLGDQQTAAVVRGKISKKALMAKAQAV